MAQIIVNVARDPCALAIQAPRCSSTCSRRLSRRSATKRINSNNAPIPTAAAAEMNQAVCQKNRATLIEAAAPCSFQFPSASQAMT